ncbi:MAG: hypothetical protein WD872_08525 [Pirellulaceae bacterium]
MSKNPEAAEYGDFQTPPTLAQSVCELLARDHGNPAALLEPTCGFGNFLFAGLDRFPSIQQALGSDINAAYVASAKAVLRDRPDAEKVRLTTADFFQTDWLSVFADLPAPILILGNLPWVTSAGLGTLKSRNLPEKANFQNHHGLDAITGKANFDISEWMLIRLVEALNGRQGVIAMLCKSSVARKVLAHCWRKKISLATSALYRIDSALHFDVAVDAVLLVMELTPAANQTTAEVFPGLRAGQAEAVIGFEDGLLLADVNAYRGGRHLRGAESIKWRSGIKHDCSKVMELFGEGERFRNGLGELVELEETFIYPMLKGSDVANSRTTTNRFMLVTQRSVGEDTARIETIAPRTWDYLVAHSALLDKRGSSIYRNRPSFSIFGVGEYSFAPWKVAICGFYKRLRFAVVGPLGDKPVVLDDTSYFLPCQTKLDAEFLAGLLNSPAAQAFYRAFVFWDAKRPITAEILRRLDLRRLSEQAGMAHEFDLLELGSNREPLLWPA